MSQTFATCHDSFWRRLNLRSAFVPSDLFLFEPSESATFAGFLIENIVARQVGHEATLSFGSSLEA